MIKKRQKQNKQKGNFVFSGIALSIFVFLFFFFGQKIINWFNSSWDGKRQISFAVEAKSKDILILLITPEKKLISVVVVPSNLEIETPWFDRYQAGKLSLLSQQEKNLAIFSRSLTYFLGIPIDFGIINTNFKLNSGEFSFKEQFLKLFFPPKSARDWQIWQNLAKKDFFWKVIYLPKFCQEKILPDDSSVLVLDQGRMVEIADYFGDPVIREESLAISVFNLGPKEGLAQKAAGLINNMGGVVVEIGDKDFDTQEDCLILIFSEEIGKKAIILRLKSVLGCGIEIDDKLDPDSAQILIRNVKI